MYLVIGIVLGVLAMAFLMVLNSFHRQYHEIEWHDAEKEKPTIRPEDGVYMLSSTPRIHEKGCVRLLVYTSEKYFFYAYYWPERDFYSFIGRSKREDEKIIYFSYVDELLRTIPPCPLCTGVPVNDPCNLTYPYANSGTL